LGSGCHGPEKFTGALDIVIEVISPGPENRRRDLLVKRQLYGKYGLSEYWIVDPENRRSKSIAPKRIACKALRP